VFDHHILVFPLGVRIPLKVAIDSAPKLLAITTKVAVFIGALAT
jgi:hypothetical protein